MTFFPWEKLPPGEKGAGMVTATAFSIPSGSLGFWRDRFIDYKIITTETKRFGDRVIQFEDPHGLSLELIETSAMHAATSWTGSPIPPAHGIVGFHSATTMLRSIKETQFLLVDVMGMERHDREQNRYRFKMKNDESFGHFYDVVVDPKAENGRQGGGTVHHIAFRTPTDGAQIDWQRALRENGFSVTPIRDRKYFKSIYLNEPGGVLFEIATDPPGFTADESYDNLGQGLMLPDQYEPMRAEIENRLPKLDAASKGSVRDPELSQTEALV
jgi:glyoxalase family protein